MGSVRLGEDRDGFPIVDGSYVQVFREDGEHLTYGWAKSVHVESRAVMIQDKEGRNRCVISERLVVRKPSVRAISMRKLVDAQLSAATERLKRRRMA